MIKKLVCLEEEKQKIFSCIAAGGKFARDYNRVIPIIEKLENGETVTASDRKTLVNTIAVSYHTGGKIAGVYSIDSSATGCTFCQAMRRAAAKNKMIICGKCYDYSQEHSFKGKNVFARHWLNMVILSAIEFTIEELKALKIPAYAILRFNASGDIENIVHAKNCINIARAFPGTHSALWGKNTAAVDIAFEDNGKPENMIFIQSDCVINGSVNSYVSPHADYVFTVYEKKIISAVIAGGGASVCNGRKCSECGYKCYFGTHEYKTIAELLRDR